MRIIIHKADSRGYANHGWMESYHTFSFAKYINPERMNFGVLKVLNDDTIKPKQGFVNHPHENFELLSLVLKGTLLHKDSTGKEETLLPGDMQLMSAGKGIWHSEFNTSETDDLKFLQVFILPNIKDTEPSYNLRPSGGAIPRDGLIKIASPDGENSMKINQNAYIYAGMPRKDEMLQYNLTFKNNGIYIFVIEGEIQIFNHTLTVRDGMGIEFIQKLEINAKRDSYFLLFEVPME